MTLISLAQSSFVCYSAGFSCWYVLFLFFITLDCCLILFEPILSSQESCNSDLYMVLLFSVAFRCMPFWISCLKLESIFIKRPVSWVTVCFLWSCSAPLPRSCPSRAQLHWFYRRSLFCGAPIHLPSCSSQCCPWPNSASWLHILSHCYILHLQF